MSDDFTVIERVVTEMARRLDDQESLDTVLIRLNHMRTRLAPSHYPSTASDEPARVPARQDQGALDAPRPIRRELLPWSGCFRYPGDPAAMSA